MSTTVFPTLRYRDAPAAIAWLTDALGFARRQVMENPDGTIAHAELTHGTGMIMLGSVTPPDTSPYSQVAPPPGASSIYVVIEDTDAHHERSRRERRS